MDNHCEIMPFHCFNPLLSVSQPLFPFFPVSTVVDIESTDIHAYTP